MTKISNPHDSFFRLLLSSKEIAMAFFDYFLPEALKEKLDLRSLEMIKDSYINRNLSNRFADLVFSCKTTVDSQVSISILLEHKSELVKKPHIQL